MWDSCTTGLYVNAGNVENKRFLVGHNVVGQLYNRVVWRSGGIRMTIREYARQRSVSYEAIRKQINRCQKDLEGHITTKGQTKYLDEYAVEYLDQRRSERPVSVVQALRDQIDALKNELMTTQKRLIDAQSENQLLIEAKTKYDLLLESSNEKTATIETLREDLTESRKTSDQLRDDLKSARDETDQLRKQADEAKERAEKLKKERDTAAKEAKSYRKSVFGLYRKIKG